MGNLFYMANGSACKDCKSIMRQDPTSRTRDLHLTCKGVATIFPQIHPTVSPNENIVQNHLNIALLNVC